MPKKYRNPALLTKPATSAPSTLGSGKAPAPNNNGAPSKPTVNELIRESRRGNGKEKQTLDIATLSSLPPSLRAVLDMPAPAPPLARTQLRGPARLRRIPGPPPPQSWLTDSQYAPESSRSTFHQLRWLRARIQQQSSTLPGGYLPHQRSLEHMILKAIATNWAWHVEYDNTYLATLPAVTRAALLSYLAVYNEAHWPNPFPFLFPSECEQDELDAVTRLDLSNSLGSWATVKRIEKELLNQRQTKDVPASEHATKKAQTASESFAPHDDGSPLQEIKTETLTAIPDSWDDDDTGSSSMNIPTLLSKNQLRFVNLKHLSLAVNPASSAAPPSWASLISLSSHLSRLTSLSLANWSTPTYTPNASKGRVKMVNTAVPSMPSSLYGGTDMYTAFDNNWREAAGILRSLSRNLYCLTWLDLSGCAPWLVSLTWRDEVGDMISADWNGSWRNVTTLILAVGWLPGKPPDFDDETLSSSRSTSSMDSARAIAQLYGGSEAIQTSLAQLAELRLNSRPGRTAAAETPWNVEHEREKQYFRRDVERYVSQQTTAKNMGEEIKSLRKAVGGRYIEFEYGDKLGDELTSGREFGWEMTSED